MIAQRANRSIRVRSVARGLGACLIIRNVWSSRTRIPWPKGREWLVGDVVAHERAAYWADLQRAAPEVATRARAVIDQSGFMYAATIRQDGTPRISPVEPHLIEDHLAIALIPPIAQGWRHPPRPAPRAAVTDHQR